MGIKEGRYAHYENVKADFDRYDSLLDVFESSIKIFPDSIAFSCMGAEISYQELDNKSRQFAAWPQAHKDLSRGSKIALMMPNLLQYPVALFGVLRAGMVAVKAFVVLKDGESLSDQEVIDFSHEHLTGYKAPDFVEFRDNLPKNNVGKILHRELREVG